jgi:hypothetical protein
MVPPRRVYQPIFVIVAISRRDRLTGHMPLFAASTKRFV